MVVKSQQLRYGDRTARGIAAGKRVCCGLAYWMRESRKSSKWVICAVPIVDWALPESAPEGKELWWKNSTTRSVAQGNFDGADSIKKDRKVNLRSLAHHACYNLREGLLIRKTRMHGYPEERPLRAREERTLKAKIDRLTAD